MCCIRSEYGRRVRVLIPLPDSDFDVTEVAVPWRLLTDAGGIPVYGNSTRDWDLGHPENPNPEHRS